MKQRGIIMRDWEVRAIREGRKTQFRRLVKSQRHPFGHLLSPEEVVVEFLNLTESIRCPYGQPGDHLWVKETWAQVHPIQVSEGRFSLKGRAGIPGPPPVDYRVIYRSDGEYPRIHFQRGDPKYPYRELCVEGCKREHIHPEERWNGWASSALMPRWASRITLEIVSVRAQRLQDITEEDAKAEGVEVPRCGCDVCATQSVICTADASEYVMAYRELWESINGPGSWERNDFVFAVEFKEVKP